MFDKYKVPTMTFAKVASLAMQYGYEYAIASNGQKTALSLAAKSKQAKTRGWTLATALTINEHQKPFPALVKYSHNGDYFSYYRLSFY